MREYKNRGNRTLEQVKDKFKVEITALKLSDEKEKEFLHKMDEESDDADKSRASSDSDDDEWAPRLRSTYRVIKPTPIGFHPSTRQLFEI